MEQNEIRIEGDIEDKTKNDDKIKIPTHEDVVKQVSICTIFNIYKQLQLTLILTSYQLIWIKLLND